MLLENINIINPTEVCDYLPHRAVRMDSSTTEFVWFSIIKKKNIDAVSVNDCLCSRPSIVRKLPQMLMQFRLWPLAACSDLAKEFFMLAIDVQDRNFTTFLWPRDPKDP